MGACRLRRRVRRPRVPVPCGARVSVRKPDALRSTVNAHNGVVGTGGRARRRRPGGARSISVYKTKPISLLPLSYFIIYRRMELGAVAACAHRRASRGLTPDRLMREGLTLIPRLLHD